MTTENATAFRIINGRTFNYLSNTNPKSVTRWTELALLAITFDTALEAEDFLQNGKHGLAKRHIDNGVYRVTEGQPRRKPLNPVTPQAPEQQKKEEQQ